MPRHIASLNPPPAHQARHEAYTSIILELLEIEPMGNEDLTPFLPIGRTSIRRYTNKMHFLRQIHICGHRMPAVGGCSRPLFAPGDKPDVPRVSQDKRNRQPGIDRRAARLDEVLASLKVESTAKVLAERIAMSKGNVQKYINILLGPYKKKIRIARWVKGKSGVQWIPVYAIGTERNAPRPPASVRTLCRQRNKKASKSRTPGSDEIKSEAARRAVQQVIESARARPHGFFAALGV